MAITFNHNDQVYVKDGKMGIGASDPLRDLHVVGNFAVNAGTDEYYGVYIPGHAEGSDPQILIGDWHNASATITWDSSARALNIDTQYSSGAGTFNITGNDGASTFLTVNTSGNVGIGTTNPAGKLHVDGGRSYFTPSGDSDSGTNSHVIDIYNANDTAFTTDALAAYNNHTSWDIGSKSTYTISSRTKQGSIYTFAGEHASAAVAINRYVQLNSDNDNPLLNWTFYQWDGAGTAATDLKVPNKVWTVQTYQSGGSDTLLILNGDGTLQLSQYGAGVLTTDSAGNVGVSTGYITQSTADGRYVNVTGDTMTDQLVIQKTGNFTAAKFKGTAADGYGQINVENDLGTALILGSMGSTKTGTFFDNARYIGATSGELVLKTYSSTDGHMKFLSGGQNERMRITAGGNVGIGTTSPDEKLDVSDGNAQMLFGAASSDRSWLQFKHNAVPADGEELGLLDFRGYNDASEDTRYVILTAKAEDVTDGSEDGSLTFQTIADGTATQTLTMRSGNVGIGTTGPLQKLDVSGVAYFRGGTAADFGSGNTPTDTALVIDEGDFIYTKDNTYLRRLIGKTTGDIIQIGESGTSLIDGIELKPGSGGSGRYIAFFDNNTESARFTGGNLGIGTTSPQTTLEVNGSIDSFVSHFGQGQNNGDGEWGGISIGYSETSNSLYRKIGIVGEAHADGAARQHLHFLVDTVSDANSATLSDSKMMIDGFNGNVGIGTTNPSEKLTVNGKILLENSGTPIFTIKDTGNSGGGGASGMIRFKNNSGDAIGIGYTSNDTSTSDLLISTNAASTYGGYLGLDAIAITDPSSIILDPKTSVIINGDAVIGEHRIIDLPSFNMGASSVTDEYLVVCKQAPSGGGVDASGIQGRISFSRGSDGSFNNSQYIDINIQMSLDSGSVNNLDVTQFELYRDSSNPFFSQLEEIDIDGTKYVALKARSSGGGSVNHFYFEGSISDASDTNILSRVRASDSTVTVTDPQPTGFPISPYITKNQDGDMGIGTTDPSANLEVAGAVKVTDSASGVTIGGVGHASLRLNRLSTSYDNNILFNTNGDTKFRIWQDGNADYLYIRDDDNATNMVTFKKGGNVGIGTTGPQTKLEVSGDTQVITIRTSYPSNSSQRGAFLWKDSANIVGAIDTRYDGTTVDMHFGSLYNSGYNSTSRLVIKGDGNVGIGTTSPDGKLNIKASYTSSATITNDASDYAINVDFLGTNGSIAAPQYGAHFAIRDSNGAAVAAINGVDQGASGATGLSFLTGDVNGLSDRLHITNTGNVGIGTTSPSDKLEVKDGSIRVTTSNSFSNLISGRSAIPNAGGYNLGGLLFQAYSTGTTYTTGAAIYSYADGAAWTSTSVPSYLSFHTTASGATSTTERMVINSSGNVGIGTTSPSTKLHILHSGTAVSSDGVSSLVVQKSAAAATAAAINIVSGDSAEASLRFGDTTDQSMGALRYLNDVDAFSIVTNNNEQVRITSGGNVGIGTTNPTTKLEVSSSGAEGILISKDTATTSNSGRLFFETDTVSEGFSFLNSNGIMTIRSQAQAGATSGNVRVAIDGSGNVGIGTTAPQQALHIKGATNGLMMLEGDNDNGIAGCYYKTEDTDDTMNRTKGFFGFQGNNTWGLGYFTMWLDNVGDNGQVTASEERFRWERDGDFHADGDVIAYSTTTPSDIRLKKNVETIESASEKVSKLRGVEYTWSKGKLAGQREIGLIAQEVETVVPEVVKEKELPLWDDSGESYKTVDYEKLVALLIESNKEMQEEIKQLKERLDGFTK